MGVDYYTCDACGEVFSDCGHCGLCEGCEADLCGECYDKSTSKYQGDNDDGEWQPLEKCIVCQKDVVTDAMIVAFYLKTSGRTREQVEKDIKAS